METQGKRYHTIATHDDPHLDEIAAIWLLRRHGEEKFPGVSEARITIWETGGPVPDGMAEACDMEGVLAVGTGWVGPFDEHPSPGNGGKPGECAATLVAKALGLEDDPALEPILRYVLNSDTKGSSNPFDLASLVKVMHQQYPDDPIKVMNWAIEALEAKYQEQLKFLTKTRAEFERVALVEDVTGPTGRSFKMVVACSDDPQMNKFARSALGVSAAIVIQQWSGGNVQIFTNRKSGLTLYDVAQMLRLAEQQAKGKVVTTDWEKLAAEGKVEGAEEWYFHYSLMALLNGSLTAKGVPPTRLSLEQIKEIVRIGINPGAFEPSRAATCQQGKCTSTKSSPCPWYDRGLQRCRKIRYDSRK